MAHPFDVRALVGRTFGSVLDEIAPGWDGRRGFDEAGPRDRSAAWNAVFLIPNAELRAGEAEALESLLEEIKRKLAPFVAALRDGSVRLVDVEGRVVPSSVWLSGRWTVYRDDRRRVEWLEEVNEAGHKVRYYNPKFTVPGAQIPKRRAGRPETDDDVELAAARELVAAGKGEHAAAQEVAWKRYSGKTDDNRCINLARRLYGKLRKPIDGN